MAQNRYSPEDIVSKLRVAEVLLSHNETVAEVVRQLGISEQTYYRWKVVSGTGSCSRACSCASSSCLARRQTWPQPGL